MLFKEKLYLFAVVNTLKHSDKTTFFFSERV